MMDSRDRRKLHILLLLAFSLVISFQPMGITGTSYYDISPSWSFYSGTGSNSGAINFSDSVIATQIQTGSSLVTFSNLNMGDTWTTLGFHAPQGGTMEVTSISTDEIKADIDPGAGLKTWNVYVASKGVPVTVTGASSWSYSDPSKIVIINSDALASVTLSWTAIISPVVDYDPPAGTDFLDAIETNFVTGIISQYTGLIGPSFWAIIGLIALLPLQNRVGLLPLVAMVLLIWVDLQYIIPAAGLQIGMAVLILGGASALTMVFFARRRQYG